MKKPHAGNPKNGKASKFSETPKKENRLLSELVAAGHVRFFEKAENWEDAIRMSCETLEEDGSISREYGEAIIASVKKHGPYLVIMPGVAMPHVQRCPGSVSRTAVSFMKLNKPVSFGGGEEKKEATLFFTFASCDPQIHLQNITRLSELLMDEETLQGLFQANNAEDLIRLQESFDSRRE